MTTAHESFQSGTNWQHALGEHLQARAQKEHSALSTFFSNACADLERRCAEVEAPLREEQRQREELQHQYDNLYASYTSLDDCKSRAEMRADALQVEKGEFMHELEHVREENEDLVTRIEELESRFEENQNQARRQLEQMKCDFANAEMDHATSLARSEEQLEELETKLSHAQSERDEKEKAKSQLENELAKVKSSKDALDADLHRWHTVDEEYTQVIAAAEKAKDELSSRCNGLLADLEALQQSAAEDRQAHEVHAARMEQEAQRQTDELRAHHSNDLKHMKQAHQEKLDEAAAKLETVRDESRHAQVILEAQIQKGERRISEYQKKVREAPLPAFMFHSLIIHSWTTSRKCVRRRMTKSRRPTLCAQISWPPWVSERRTKAASLLDDEAQDLLLVSPRSLTIQMPRCHSSIS